MRSSTENQDKVAPRRQQSHTPTNSGRDRPSAGTPTEAWDGKVLRNRVIPPVNPRGPAPIKQSKEISASSPLLHATAPSLRTLSGPTKVSAALPPKGQDSSALYKDTQSTARPLPEVFTLPDEQQDTQTPIVKSSAVGSRAVESSSGVSAVPPTFGRPMDNSASRGDTTPQGVRGGAYVNSEGLQKALQQPEFQFQLMVAAVQESVRAAFSSEMAQVQEQTRRAPTGCRAPPIFQGAGAKLWLLQLENYHDMLNMPRQDRVKDAVSYLAGRALTEYALEQERGRQPQSWSEFKRWVYHRFHTQTENETVRRLLALEWEGSLDKLSARFAAILSEGVAPPDAELVRLFVRALPYDLVVLLESKPFESWVDVRDHLAERTAPKGQWTTMWLASVSDGKLREAERRMPQHFPHTQQLRQWASQPNQRQGERAEGPHRHFSSDRSFNRFPNNQANPGNKPKTNQNHSSSANIICLKCNGVGHIAARCPNAIQQFFKDGAKCGRCKGVGHWATHCPSPAVQPTNGELPQLKSNHRFVKENGGAQRNPNESGNGAA